MVLSGCSRKKDTFINRNYHAITSEYNTLYNGHIALDAGTEQIAATYRENFWQLLPVERMQVAEEVILPGSVKNEHFRRAEEKAAKTIQKHSMLLQGREKNPQIDEAYLLLGKARYYEQRFIPALEAFNYILQNYPGSNTINHARIWREKVNLRLENEKLAIRNLKKVLESENLQDQDRADAGAMLAQAYINTGYADSAAVAINSAAKATGKNEEKGRYYFIEGQLLNRLGDRSNANLAFDKVIELNRKTPREYIVNAQLEKIRNFDYATGDSRQLLENLQELEENRENRPYLDKIYFQIAEYFYHLDSLEQAINNYNLSLLTGSDDDFLHSVNYESLGNIYFDQSLYRLAGAYYDSTLTKIPNNSRDFFRIKRKKDNLQEVIRYEEIAEKNDSILKLVAMSDGERLEYFTSYTNRLKEEALDAAKKGNVPEPPAMNINRGPGAPPAIGSPVTGNSFYFYNPQRVAAGMQEFVKTWGPRKLQDNWRLQSGSAENSREGQLDEVTELIITGSPKYNPATYLEKIPSDTDVIEKLRAERDDAYYKLGLIYKEKFGEYGLAAERLESLLEMTSEERLIVPAHYHLYQLRSEEGSFAQAGAHKQKILREYPESRYADVIRNPGEAMALRDAAEEKYREVYQFFEQGQYIRVLELTQEYSAVFEGDELLPKFELLKAMATGRLRGFEAYKEALNYVALNYPQTEEGKKAQQLLTTALPKLANNEFVKDSSGINIKLLYTFELHEKEQALKLKEKAEDIIKNLGYVNRSVSLDVYNPEKIFVVIHGIAGPDSAQRFAETLKSEAGKNELPGAVIISSENYRVVQLHKNLEKYREQNINQ